MPPIRKDYRRNLRISATLGLTIDRFVDRRARTVAMIGSGRLALAALEPAVAVRPIERILVYSRSAENRESFAQKAGEKLKLAAQAVDSAEKAIADSDFVVVSTNSAIYSDRAEYRAVGHTPQS